MVMPDHQSAPEPDVNMGPVLLVVTGTVTGVALIVMIARIWVRRVMLRQLGPDDWFMLGAMVLSMTGMMIVIPETFYGAGRHAIYLKAEIESYGLFLNFISQHFYLVGVMMVKVSVGLFLLRLTLSGFYRSFIWAMQIFMVMYTAAAIATILTQCRPLGVLWKDPTIQQFTCFPPSTIRLLAYLNAGFSIFADLAMALLPIPMLWKVQMNRRVKVAVVVVLSLGLCAVGACIVKVSYLPTYGQYNDFLWDSFNLTLWTAVELNIGIVAGSIPCLRPLFNAVLTGSNYGSGYLRSERLRKGSMSCSHYHEEMRAKTRPSISKQSISHPMPILNPTMIGSGALVEESFEMYTTPVETYWNRGMTISSDNQGNRPPGIGSETQNNRGILKTTQVFVHSDEVEGPATKVDDRV